MAKYELQTQAAYFGGHEWHQGDVIDFEGADEVDIQALLDSGAIAEEGTLEKKAKADEEVQRKVADAQTAAAEAQAQAAQARADQLAAAEAPAATGNVASQDGPKTQRSSTGKK